VVSSLEGILRLSLAWFPGSGTCWNNCQQQRPVTDSHWRYSAPETERAPWSRHVNQRPVQGSSIEVRGSL